MRYQSPEQKFFNGCKDYIIKLANVEGKNKLLLVFLLSHSLLTVVTMIIGLLFYIHWIVGLVVLAITVAYLSYIILFRKILNESRD